MKSKISNILSAVMFSIILLTSVVSAGFTVDTNTLTFKPGINTQSFIITNTNNSELLDVTIPSTITIDGQVFDVTGTKTNINTTSEISITPQSTLDFSGIDLGDQISEALVVTNADVTSETETITIKLENDNFCEAGDQGGDLDLRVDIENIEGLGEEDDEWYPLDTIRVEIDVENDGNDDIDEIVVEWGLYDNENAEFVIDDEEKEFDLRDGKKEELTIEFTVDPADLDIDSDDYTFYVKAYSDDLGEDVECASESNDIKVVYDDDLVALGDIDMTESVNCGTDVQLTAEVWNIGEDDQEDVYVVIFSPELDLSQRIEIGDVDTLEDEKLVFNIEVPNDASEKLHDIELTVYDEDNDVYESDTDEDSRYLVLMRVDGGCAADGASVSAVLESGGNAGKDLVVKATVTNTGGDLVAYNLNAAGFTEWAESADISQKTVVLDGGASTEVLITFDVKSDVEGDQSFDIELVSDGQLILKQPVAVTIENGGFSLGGNWYLWLIGLLNLILVIVIIVVAVRILKK